MPLRDHFSPPLKHRRHWGAFHGAWANEMATRLNRGVLPDAYIAEPFVTWGGQVEIDIATQTEAMHEEGGGLALATYAPPAAKIAIPVDWTAQDVVEVRVSHDEGGMRLVAAIELVSPANKDRPSHREAFVAKCLGYLRAGVSVVVVDIVTSRTAHLFGEMAAALGAPHDFPTGRLYTASSRMVAGAEGSVIECWPESLEIGQPLPTLPLWFSVDLAAPLDLEDSYQAACENLRID